MVYVYLHGNTKHTPRVSVNDAGFGKWELVDTAWENENPLKRWSGNAYYGFVRLERKHALFTLNYEGVRWHPTNQIVPQSDCIFASRSAYPHLEDTEQPDVFWSAGNGQFVRFRVLNSTPRLVELAIRAYALGCIESMPDEPCRKLLFSQLDRLVLLSKKE
jgi:hypothetical protein